jgi:hypothetical protein
LGWRRRWLAHSAETTANPTAGAKTTSHSCSGRSVSEAAANGARMVGFSGRNGRGSAPHAPANSAG